MTPLLAHRVNQTTTGCVFVNDYPHVERINFGICESKMLYGIDIKESFGVFYSGIANEYLDDSKSSTEAKSLLLKELKKRLAEDGIK